MNAHASTPVVIDGVLYGFDREVAAWVAERVPVMTGRSVGQATAALGVIRGGKIVAGLTFQNYREGVDIEVSLAADSPRWAHPATLRRLFRYPFVQLGLPRLTCITARKNKRARKLIEGMGWKLEGKCRRAYDGVQDAMIYGMLADDCRFKPEA